MSLAVSDALRYASYLNEPRELNEDEIMAADEDGDQLLLFQLPGGSSRRYANPQNSDVYRMLRQQDRQEQDESVTRSRTYDDERRSFVEQSRSMLIDNNNSLNNAEIGANQVSNNRLIASKYSHPMTISTGENWVLENGTPGNASPLSPRSNGDTLSPSGSTSGSSRRSALPVPVRYIASPFRSKQPNGESPSTTAVPQYIRPTSANVRHSKEESPSSFVRHGVTRASMFERGSRPNITSSTPAMKATRNGATSADQSVIYSTPRRSVSPSPSYSRTPMQTMKVSPAEENSMGINKRRGAAARLPPVDTRTRDRRWNEQDEMTPPSLNPAGNFGRVTSSASLNTASAISERHEKTNSSDDTSLWDFRLTITDVGDILTSLSSSEWTDRRDALANLQNMFKTNACISLPDLKRITDIFTRMFHDPQKKVFAMLAEILADFFYVHADDLDYWIPTVLPRLFVKIGGADVRGSVQTKIQRALDTARDTFNLDVQIETIVNFMTEQSQLQVVKTKEAVLSYLHELVLNMDTDELVNTPAIRSLLLRVVLWASEAQSSEIRKEALAIVPAMFSVNAPEFSLVMMSQPKGVQDMVERILKSHMRTTQGIVEEPREQTPRPVVKGRPHRPMTGQQQSRQTQPPNNRNVRSVPEARPREVTSRRTSAPSPNEKTRIINQQPLKSTPTRETKSNNRTPVERRQFFSGDSSVATHNVVGSGGYSSPEVKVATPTSHFEIPESPKASADVSRSFISSPPAQKPTLQRCIGDIPAEICINDNPDDCAKWWASIVETLSSNIASRDGRSVAIRQLIDSMPNNPGTISPGGINTILALLFATTSVNDEVSTLALECASMLLDSIGHPLLKCRVLSQLSELGVQPINLAALTLLEPTLNTITDEDLNRCLKELVTSLLKVYEDDDRSVRKAGVDNLVHLYVRVGDQIWLFINGLSDAKANFLKTRFRRAFISHSTGRDETLS